MGWRGVGWGGMLTFMWRSWCYVDHGVGWDVNVHVTLMMLRWSMLMVLVHGPKLRKFWKFLVFKWIISIKNMLPQFVRCPKDCPRSVEHRPLIQIGNRWSAGFPRKLPKKGTGDLVTHSSKLEQRVWQWMWRRTELRGNNSEKLAAMSKLFNGWGSFWDVKKPACKPAYAIPMGNSRAHP